MALGEGRKCAQCQLLEPAPGSIYCRVHVPPVQLGPNIAQYIEGRPSWDDTWLAVAEVMAKRSKCSRAQVGAVIVADDQTVISASYNGPPKGMRAEGSCENWCPRVQTDDPSPTYDDCPSAHAEANAIARADYSRMQGATIYVSTSCCKGCAKLLANSGIVRVVFRNEEGRDYRKPEETIDFLRECGIKVSVVHDRAS